MGAIKLATSTTTDEEYGGTFATQATDVAYDNTTSGLTADDVQEAIDEVNGKTNNVEYRYIDRASVKTYVVPISTLRKNHDYGCALVGAWEALFLLFFIASNNEIKITKLGDNGSVPTTATVSYDSTTENITITFNQTIWDGITILPI